MARSIVEMNINNVILGTYHNDTLAQKEFVNLRKLCVYSLRKGNRNLKGLKALEMLETQNQCKWIQSLPSQIEVC